MGQLTRTPGFTLEHLRFLVVDETDRLLRQSYQDWLPLVLAATGGAAQAPGAAAHGLLGAPAFAPPSQLRTWRGTPGSRIAPEGRLCKLVVSATLSRDPAKMSRLEIHSPVYFVAGETGQRCAPVVFLFPPPLDSCSPSSICGGQRGHSHDFMCFLSPRYSIPPTLKQWRVEVAPEHKPAALLALLSGRLRGKRTIVFTSSLEVR